MNIQISSDNLKLTPSMEQLANSKLKPILKLIKEVPQDLIHIRVVLNKGSEQDTFTVKLDISAGKLKAVSKESDYSLESAIVGAVSDSERQIRREKSPDSSDWEKRREMKRFKPDPQDLKSDS